jgi:hypothetical protein
LAFLRIIVSSLSRPFTIICAEVLNAIESPSLYLENLTKLHNLHHTFFSIF